MSPPRLSLVIAAFSLCISPSVEAAPSSWSAPAAASGQPNPFAGDESAAIKGREIFDSACLVCHGSTGKGDGPAGMALSPRPSDLTSGKAATQSDGSLHWKIANGRAPMPGFGEVYGEADIWRLVTYVRSLGPEAGTVSTTSTPQADVSPSSDAVQQDEVSSGEGNGDGGILDKAASLVPGHTSFLLAGYATANYASIKDEDTFWGAKLAPIFLWKQGEGLLFEGEVEIDLADGETEVNLEYAQLLWVANDYMTLGVGKFLNPMNYYAERLHPGWISRLPDAPLPFGHDGSLIAGTQLGVQARGGIPWNNMRIGYSVYVSNGPSIIVGDTVEEDEHGGEAEPEESEAGHGGEEEGGHGPAAGTLDYGDFTNREGNLAIGGRIGVLPIPGLEIGYGVELAEVDPSDGSFTGIQALTQSVDINYVRHSDLLQGVIVVRGQYVWLSIDNPGVEPLDFENNSSGGYVQVAYRPIELDQKIIRNLEGVCRFAWIDPAGDSSRTERLSVGLNYWINPSTVIKVSADFDTRGKTDYTGVQAQAAIGF